jgi:hypothetical protein
MGVVLAPQFHDAPRRSPHRGVMRHTVVFLRPSGVEMRQILLSLVTPFLTPRLAPVRLMLLRHRYSKARLIRAR